LYKIPANTLFMGQKLIYVPECHSTNSSLADLTGHADLPEGLVLITDNQTMGRGQRGNQWEAKPKENLTFSVLLKPKFLAARDQFQLNMAVALGIAEGLTHLVSRTVSLKWPNDIMIGDQKVGGILIENQSVGANLSEAIVGIGINVNQREFVNEHAVSLTLLLQSALSLEDVLIRLLTSLEAWYLQLRSGAVHVLRQAYLNSLYRYRQPQAFEAGGQSFIGTIIGIDEYGRLCVETKTSTKSYSLQEIKMVL